VIVWTWKVREKPHFISYVGDRAACPRLAPEMDRFADAFMKKFSEAGLKTGLTIRPTNTTSRRPARATGRNREVATPVTLMSERSRMRRSGGGHDLLPRLERVRPRLLQVSAQREHPWTVRRP